MGIGDIIDDWMSKPAGRRFGQLASELHRADQRKYIHVEIRSIWYSVLGKCAALLKTDARKHASSSKELLRANLRSFTAFPEEVRNESSFFLFQSPNYHVCETVSPDDAAKKASDKRERYENATACHERSHGQKSRRCSTMQQKFLTRLM